MSWVPFCIFILFSVRLSWLFAEQVSLAFRANCGTIHWHCGNVLETTLDAAFQICTIRTSKHPTLSIELSSVHRLVCCSNYEVFIEFDPSLLLFWMTPRAETRDVAMWHTNFRFPSNYVYFWIYTNICVYILYMYIYIYTAVYLSLSLYICTYLCIYIYTHIYICTCAKGSPTKFWRNEATFWPETYEDQSAGFTSFSL